MSNLFATSLEMRWARGCLSNLLKNRTRLPVGSNRLAQRKDAQQKWKPHGDFPQGI